MSWLPYLPPWVFFLLAFLTFLFVATLNHATKLRLASEPKFALSFDKDGLGITTEHIEDRLPHGMTRPPWRAAYVRIQLDAIADANVPKCVVAITNFWKRSGGDESSYTWHPLGQPSFLSEPFEIIVGIPHRIEILTVDENSLRLRLTPNITWPVIWKNAFNDPGDFKFEITANAGGRPKILDLEVSWGGTWGTLTARELAVRV